MGEGTLRDEAVQALIRAVVACEVALEALPHLPEDLRRLAQPPVQELCRIVQPALEAIQTDAKAS
jgi:hypothetical protein